MLTEQQSNQLDWEKTDGLMPAIVQHAVSGEVLMLGYMTPEALATTEQSGNVTFFSRTKQRLWTKGESSGHFLKVVSITPDCDNDTLLVLANPIGPTCHLGNSSCFHPAASDWTFLYQLEQLLAERKHASPDSSYTASLYASGTKRIAQKVGEEGVETALAATVNDREELTNEASDLIYHLLVLLQDPGAGSERGDRPAARAASEIMHTGFPDNGKPYIRLFTSARISSVFRSIKSRLPRDSTLRRSKGSVFDARKLNRQSVKIMLIPSVLSTSKA